METNYDEAAKWFRKAADQGLPEAQNNLGLCYAKGLGVDKNYFEATNWYHKAEKQIQRRKIQNNLMSVAKWTLLGGGGVFLLYLLLFLKRLFRMDSFTISSCIVDILGSALVFAAILAVGFLLYCATFVDLPLDDEVAFRKAERYVKDNAPMGVEVESARDKPYSTLGFRATYVFYLRSPGVKEKGKVGVVVYKRAIFYFVQRD